MCGTERTLTVEPATPLGLRVAAGASAPDDDLQADAYLLAESLLGAAGLEWYEVSNWARPGEECRHNLLYWSEGEHLAIGCAAHGHGASLSRGGGSTRWWNVRTPERYIAAIEAGTSAVAGSEQLEPTPRAEEACALRARTCGGARPTGRRWKWSRSSRRPVSCAGSTIAWCSPLTAASSHPM